MAWIEVHQSLPTHRKTLLMADLLDAGPAHVTGHLVCLWLWALDNAPGGQLDVSPRMLARAAQWEGDPDAFVHALTAAGFLHENGQVHDWDVYAGRLLDQRQRNTARVKSWRERTRSQPPIDSGANAHVTRNERARYGATIPNRTGPSPPLIPPHPSANGAVESAPDKPARQEEQTSRSAPTGQPVQRPRSAPADALWEALAAECGKPETRAEKAARVAAHADLAEAGASPEEVARRAAEYRKRWPQVTLTALALAKHWGELAPQRRQRPAAATSPPPDPPPQPVPEELRRPPTAEERERFAADMAGLRTRFRRAPEQVATGPPSG